MKLHPNSARASDMRSTYNQLIGWLERLPNARKAERAGWRRKAGNIAKGYKTLTGLDIEKSEN